MLQHPREQKDEMASVFQKGSHALITGGASGIGLSLTKRCLRHGMQVLVADWDDELLSQLSSSADSKDIITFKMDVGKLEDWTRLKGEVDLKFGGLMPLYYYFFLLLAVGL